MYLQFIFVADSWYLRRGLERNSSAPVMVQSGCSLSLLTSYIPQIETVPSSFLPRWARRAVKAMWWPRHCQWPLVPSSGYRRAQAQHSVNWHDLSLCNGALLGLHGLCSAPAPGVQRDCKVHDQLTAPVQKYLIAASSHHVCARSSTAALWGAFHQVN